MASSMIDTLLQAAAPPRAADAPRGGDSRGTFAPVLNEALQTDRREPGSQSALRDAADGAEDDLLEPTEAASSGVEESSTGCGVSFDETDGDGSSADEQDLQTAAADDELAAADAEDDEADADAVEISAAAIAAAEAAALAAAENSAVDVAADGNADEGQLAAANAAADDTKTGNASDQSSQQSPTDADALELGDARVQPSRRLGEAPPNLDTLKAAVKAAAEAAQAQKEGRGADNAASKTARSKAGASKERVESTGDASASSDGNDAADSIDGDAAKQIKAAILAQQVDEAVTAVADPNGAPTTTQSQGGEANAATATAAAPTVPSASGEAGSSTRSAAALARLSADRSMGAGADSGEQIDRARFVGRVEGAIRTAQQRDGRVHVRLSPPELGALRIELTMQNGVLSARLEAETSAARNLLLDNLPALRDRLAQQDVRIDQFDVDVRRDGGGSAGQQQQQAQDRQAQDPQWRQAQQRQSRTTTTAHVPSPARATNLTSDAALDVRV